MTWGKLLDFFEPHSPYLKIGIIIVFLAHSQHSIKVSYFYCLLGKKSNAKTVLVGSHGFAAAVSQHFFVTFPESGNLIGTAIFSQKTSLCC